jgi:multimeric flavodoxin WrbA
MVAMSPRYPDAACVEPRLSEYLSDVKALIVNCTLKPSPGTSDTEALAEVVAAKLRAEGVEVSEIRAVDKAIAPGVESDMGEGDGWPPIRQAILDAEILVVATPTWVGRPASVTQRVLERLDAMISETDDSGRPLAHGKVAGVLVSGETAAQNLVAAARALADESLPAPISS